MVGKTSRTTKPIHRMRCHAMTAEGRCENWCSLLPFCPTHCLFKLNLLIDLQAIVPGQFDLGMYAFNVCVGPRAPVFVSGSEMVSGTHLSSFRETEKDVIGRTNGRAFYTVLCAERMTELERAAVYDSLTGCNVFTLADGSMMDCTWYQGIITMANMQAGQCNARFVPHEISAGVHSVSVETTRPVRQGGAIFALYSDEREGEDAYDFSRIPRTEETPVLPGLPAEGTLYDFRRGVAEVLPPLPTLRAVGRTEKGLIKIEQTEVRDMRGMIAFFKGGVFGRIMSLPAFSECQTWLKQLVDLLDRTRGFGVRLTLDMALRFRGELLVESLQLWHKRRQFAPARQLPNRTGKRRRVAEEPRQEAFSRDLALMVIIMAVVMPSRTLSPDAIVGLAYEHLSSFLSKLIDASERGWSESDSVVARAVVGFFLQMAPWKRPLLIESLTRSKAEFDQLKVREGWCINLPVALLCPDGASSVHTQFKQWRTRIIEEHAYVAIRPPRLQRVHTKVFARMRKVLASVYDEFIARSTESVPLLRTVLGDICLDLEYNAASEVAEILRKTLN